jgi:hypothetical protein
MHRSRGFGVEADAVSSYASGHKVFSGCDIVHRKCGKVYE